MQTKSRTSFMMVLFGAIAVLAAAGVLAAVFLGGDDDDEASVTTASPNGQDGLPEFALNYPKTWKPVDAKAPKDGPPRATIQRRDGSGVITMTINGPVQQSLDELRGDLAPALRKRFPGLQKLSFKRIETQAGDGLMSTWVSKDARVQSNLVVPSGTVSYSIDAVVSPGKNKAATEVGSIYAAFDAKPAR